MLSNYVFIVYNGNIYSWLLALVSTRGTVIWGRRCVLLNYIEHFNYIIISWWEASDNFRRSFSVLLFDLYVLELGPALILSTRLLLRLWMVIILITQLFILNDVSFFNCFARTLIICICILNDFDFAWLLNEVFHRLGLFLGNTTWCVQSRCRRRLVRENTLMMMMMMVEEVVIAFFWV